MVRCKLLCHSAYTFKVPINLLKFQFGEKALEVAFSPLCQGETKAVPGKYCGH